MHDLGCHSLFQPCIAQKPSGLCIAQGFAQLLCSPEQLFSELLLKPISGIISCYKSLMEKSQSLFSQEIPSSACAGNQEKHSCSKLQIICEFPTSLSSEQENWDDCPGLKGGESSEKSRMCQGEAEWHQTLSWGTKSPPEWLDIHEFPTS